MCLCEKQGWQMGGWEGGVSQNSFTFATKWPNWHNFYVVCISTAEVHVCELPLLVRLQEFTKLQ